MQKRLVITVCVILFIAFVVAFFNKDADGPETASVAPAVDVTPGSPVPQTTLRLVPNPARPDSLGNVKLNVSAITNANKISTVHFVISYDPTVLSFIDIDRDDSFDRATVTDFKVDAKQGRIEYGLSIKNVTKTQMMQGNDHVAEIEFKPKVYSGETTVKIAGLDVQALGVDHSVLKNSVSTTIDLTR